MKPESSAVSESPSCCCGGSVPPPTQPVKRPTDGAKREQNLWFRLGVALIIAGQSMVFGLGLNLSDEKLAYGSKYYWPVHGGLILAALAVLALLGPALFKEQAKAIKARKVTVEGLFILSLLGAFVGSLVSTLSGEGSVYYEVVAIVLVVYTFGKLVGTRSRRKALEAAAKMREDYAHAWVLEENERRRMPIDELCKCSSRVSVAPGEPVTIDGLILEGEGYVTETSLTGEPVPMVRRPGDRLYAGSHSVDASFVLRPEKLAGERRMDAILHAVERGGQDDPSSMQKLADKLVRGFLPLVVLASTGTFVTWLLILPAGQWWQALFNAMAVLLVACPCALGLATPTAVWGGLLRFSSLGLIAHSGRLLDTLACTRMVVFDKTGTVSNESLALIDFATGAGISTEQREWLRAAASAVEADLNHPAARALYDEALERLDVRERRLVPGQGVQAVVEGRTIRIGEASLMHGGAEAFASIMGASPALADAGYKKLVYMSVDDSPAAVVVLDETLREGTTDAFRQLTALDAKLLVLTGDPDPRWRDIDGVQVRAGLSPDVKAREVERLKREGHCVLFVGDGINDAAAMVAADAGIAMGAGASLTRSSAEGVLPGNTLTTLPECIAIARRVRSSVRGNMLFALCYNGIGMTLAALGVLHPAVAALLMLVSSAIVSTRALRSSAGPVPTAPAKAAAPAPSCCCG